MRINALSRPPDANHRPLAAPGCESTPSRSQPRIRINALSLAAPDSNRRAVSGPRNPNRRPLGAPGSIKSPLNPRVGAQRRPGSRIVHLGLLNQNRRRRPCLIAPGVARGRVLRSLGSRSARPLAAPGCESSPSRSPRMRIIALSQPPGCESTPSRSQPPDANQRRLAAPDSNQRPLSAPGSESAPSLSPGCESTPSRSPAPSRACHSTPGSKSVVR